MELIFEIPMDSRGTLEKPIKKFHKITEVPPDYQSRPTETIHPLIEARLKRETEKAEKEAVVKENVKKFSNANFTPKKVRLFNPPSKKKKRKRIKISRNNGTTFYKKESEVLDKRVIENIKQSQAEFLQEESGFIKVSFNR